MVNLGHHQRDHIIQSSREQEFVGGADIAKHEQELNHTLAKSPVFLIGLDDKFGIAKCALSGVFQAGLEHRGEHHVEGNKASNRVVSVVLGCLMRDFQNRTFITLDFRIHVLQSHEGIEHVHNQLELIRNEWIVVDKVLLVSVLAITGRKIELGIKGRRFLVIEFSKLNDGIRILVQDTLLRDILGICSLKCDTGFESAENLSVVVACFSNVGGAEDFCQILLCRTTYPGLLGAVSGEGGNNLLELEEKL